MLEFKIICLIVVFLYTLYETDAFLEYSKIFRLKFTKYKEFEEFKKVMPSCDYNYFLLIKYPNFFVKLATCPICLTVWICAIITLIFGLGWINFGVLIIGVWAVYNLLVRFMEWDKDR